LWLATTLEHVLQYTRHKPSVIFFSASPRIGRHAVAVAVHPCRVRCRNVDTSTAVIALAVIALVAIPLATVFVAMNSWGANTLAVVAETCAGLAIAVTAGIVVRATLQWLCRACRAGVPVLALTVVVHTVAMCSAVDAITLVKILATIAGGKVTKLWSVG
jgi:hypothetical protein